MGQEDPWRKAWQPTPVFLPGESYGQRSLVGYSPWCPTLCDLMNCSTPGLPVHHQLQEFTQTHVHRVSDAIQPSHPLLSPCRFLLQGIFQIQESNPGLLHCRQMLYHLSHQGSPKTLRGQSLLQSTFLTCFHSVSPLQVPSHTILTWPSHQGPTLPLPSTHLPSSGSRCPLAMPHLHFSCSLSASLPLFLLLSPYI